METEVKHDVYEIVTNRIIELLEAGTVPWHQPWTNSGEPQNLITKIPYRGFNLLLLACLGYARNYFLTFKQAKDIGASIKKGEKSFPVVFWKWPEKKPDAKEKKEGEKVRPILRYYQVWNIEQCDGIPDDMVPSLIQPNNPIEKCETIVKEMPKCPPITHVGQKAYYKPKEDVINIPKLKFFDSSEDYYGTLFHELIHSTGHSGRLNRKDVMETELESYSMEELVAEIGACFLVSIAGLSEEAIDQGAAYIDGWLDVLHNDKRFIIFASTQAQKAVDFILSHQIRPEPVTEEEQLSFKNH